jgi:hypothetical protein
MFKLNNQPIGLDQPFTTEDGTQYPANWLRLASPEERAEIGITEVADPENYDDRFWWGVNSPKQLEDRDEVDQNGEPLYVQEYDAETQSMVNSSKRLVTKGLKSVWSAQIKDTTNKLLAESDWMIVRKYERKVAIPEATVTYRAAVLAECDRLLAAIAGAADVDALAAVLANQGWPEVN